LPGCYEENASHAGDAAGDGGTVELGEERVLLGQRIRLRRIRAGAEATAHEEARDASGDLTHQPLDLGVVGRRQRMEAQGAVRPGRVDAVEQQRVEVDVQVEGVAEALDEGDRAALAVDDAPLLARTPLERREDRAHEDSQHGARERRVVGEAVAEREGQREHPLPHGNLGQHPLDQVRCRVRHAPGAARRAEASAFAGEGDDAVESALVAVDAHEAVGKDPAAQEAPELALDEARHPALAGLGPSDEGLELRLDHPVEKALLGPAAGVLASSAAAGSVAPVGRNR
jgi:hypothetical protein